MKKYVLSFLVLSSVSLLHAQTLERKVINSIGGTYTTPSVTLRTSVGEPIVGKVSSTGSGLSQGFFTSTSPQSATAVRNIPGESAFSVYPNPASDQLYVRTSASEAVHIVIVDMLGQTVRSADLSAGSVSLAGIPAGIYIAGECDAEGRMISSSRFIKQ